jgi:hypothetical protein
VRAPPASPADIPVASVTVDPSTLLRVSSHGTGEPHFGRHGANRFDDGRLPETRRFGTCYLGKSLTVALAETLLHDEVAVAGRFAVAPDEVRRRHVVSFRGTVLKLADCTGVALKRMGLDGRFSTDLDIGATQAWAAALHGHPAAVDGLLYVSRHVNTGKAVVVFDRAAAKLQVVGVAPLREYPGATAALAALGVDFT